MMTEVGYTGTQTTTVSQTRVSPYIRWDPTFVHHVPGWVKIAEIIFNFLGFLFIEFSSRSSFSSGKFFNFTAMFGFWFTGILLVFYVFHVIEMLYKVPWLKVEMYHCAAMVVLYVIAATWAASIPNTAYVVAALFGYCAMVLYGYEGWTKYQGVLAGQIAQGERQVTQQTTVVTY